MVYYKVNMGFMGSIKVNVKTKFDNHIGFGLYNLNLKNVFSQNWEIPSPRLTLDH